MEPKDKLVADADCESPDGWPCYAKPHVIFHDRGAIFESRSATQVVVERLGIISDRAPAWAPSAKGTVESLFRWVAERFSKRHPGATMSNPKQRGAHEPLTEAAKHGITLDLLEKYLVQAIVDGHMQDWES